MEGGHDGVEGFGGRVKKGEFNVKCIFIQSRGDEEGKRG